MNARPSSQSDFTYREIDLVRVKGKTEPVAIYEPLGSVELNSTPVLAELEEYRARLRAYREPQFRCGRVDIPEFEATHGRDAI